MKGRLGRRENTRLETLLMGVTSQLLPSPQRSRTCTHPESLQGNRLRFQKSLGVYLATKVVSHLIILSLLGASARGRGRGGGGGGGLSHPSCALGVVAKRFAARECWGFILHWFPGAHRSDVSMPLRGVPPREDVWGPSVILSVPSRSL